MRKGIAIFFTIFISMIACQKTSTKSPIPKISFTSLTPNEVIAGKESKIYLRFDFEDGDGDLSFDPVDSNNIYIKDLRDSVYVPYKFPIIPPEDNPEKGLAGECIIELNAAFFNIRSDSFHQVEGKDTTMFEFYMEDKAKNKSNVEKSSPLYLFK
ncbi:MAG: hypothetical protein KA275_05785 [Chitinophagaceae bacterium]|nr:hypothetical protein [Chitinophagaceae bacterium]